MDGRLPLGSFYLGRKRSSFVVWSPWSEAVDLRVLSPRARAVRLQRGEKGYHHGIIDGIGPDTLYVYRLDGLIERPDPASRCQPHGPLGPSCVVDPHFAWKDRRWRGLPLADYIIHESSDPTVAFDDLLPGLGHLRDLGATALSVRLDAPHLFGLPCSVPASLGGPAGLKRLVDACHRRGLAVMLGIPLFEQGIEGDPFVSFGPYFTGRDRHINIDGPHSDEVRRYFIECALSWFRDFHIDAVDVGNVDMLSDRSPTPLLEELTRITQDEAGITDRPLHLVAQSRRNDPRLIRRREDGGIGFDALWNPDFCIALQGVLAQGQTASSSEFGKLEHLKKAFLEGFVCTGDFSPSRQRHHGRSSRNLPGERFLVSYPLPAGPGRRTGSALEEQKLIGATLLLSPFVPLIPHCAEKDARHGNTLTACIRELSRLRKELRNLGLLDKQCMGVLGYEKQKLLLVRHWKEDADLIILFHFGRMPARMSLPIPSGPWALRFDTADRRWNGPGNSLPERLQGNAGDLPLSFAPLSCAVYLRQHRE